MGNHNEIEVRRMFEFEAAHQLPNYDGACAHVHGHSYKLEVALKAPINPVTGMVMDFKELNRIVTEEIVSKLDHKWLNDIFPMPTAEIMVQGMWDTLITVLPGLYEVVLYETANSCAKITRGED